METTTTVAGLVGAIAGATGAKFASFDYTAKETGERAKHLLILGASTRVLYEKDIASLTELRPTLTGLKLVACDELLASLRVSLEKGIGNNPAYVHGPEQGDTYVYPIGMEGIRVHKETGEVYVNGLVESKTVIVPGTYKEVKSAPKTVAKNEIRKTLRSGKFRQYILRNVRTARMNGDVLEIVTD